MTSMDFIPPDTRETPPATDDRLRQKVMAEVLILEVGKAGEHRAFLDALTEYAREQQAAGAVAALTAIQPYIDAALRLQQAVGCMDGPLMEQFEVLEPWDRACFLHGELARDALAANTATLESLRRSG